MIDSSSDGCIYSLHKGYEKKGLEKITGYQKQTGESDGVHIEGGIMPRLTE